MDLTMATVGLSIEMEAVQALLELRVSSRVFNKNHNQASHAHPASPPVPSSHQNIDGEVTVHSAPKSPKRARSPSSEREIIHLPDGGMIIRNNKLRRRLAQAQSFNSPTHENAESPVTPRKKPVKTSYLYKSYLKERREAIRIAKQKALEKNDQVDTEHQRQMETLRANTEDLMNKIQFLKNKWDSIRQNISKIADLKQNESKPPPSENPSIRLSPPLEEPKLRVNEKRANSMEMTKIGGKAMVPTRLLKQIDGTSHTYATRKLLTAVFSRSVLATHSLTGKSSPAFPNKPPKKRLDPALVNDIIRIVCEKCNVHERDVRNIITTKCADECKMFRLKQRAMLKRKSLPSSANKENTDDDDDHDANMTY